MQKLLSWFVAGAFTWDLLCFVHIGISQQSDKLEFVGMPKASPV